MRILAVSPTAFDAVVSCGATLARHAAEGHDVVVLAAFGVAREADGPAAAALGLAGVIHAGVPDSEARGYAPGARHAGIADGDDGPRVARAALALALDRLDADLVLAPLGLPGEVDARVLLGAIDALGVDALRWVDLPHAITRTPGAPLGAGKVVAVPVGDTIEAKLGAVALYDATLAEKVREHALAEGTRAGAAGPAEVFLRRPH